jgi:hypothetical protein
MCPVGRAHRLGPADHPAGDERTAHQGRTNVPMSENWSADTSYVNWVSVCSRVPAIRTGRTTS